MKEASTLFRAVYESRDTKKYDDTNNCGTCIIYAAMFKLTLAFEIPTLLFHSIQPIYLVNCFILAQRVLPDRRRKALQETFLSFTCLSICKLQFEGISSRK